MVAINAQSLAEAQAKEIGHTGRSDRFIGWLLLLFFLALYLLTAGGHGYSPDGEFAYRMGNALTLDPKHEYLKTQGHGLSQWGIMVPLLSQPLILLGEPLMKIVPQKDHATVDGRDYVLGIFQDKGLLKDGPTVGPKGPGVEDSYVRTNLKVGPATSLTMISFLSLSEDVPQNTTVAEITLTDSSGQNLVLPIRAGVETAEWNRGKSDKEVKHAEARVASIWAGNTSGRNYFAEFPFGRTLQITGFSVHYLLPEGQLYIRALGLINKQTGSFEQIRDDGRFWSVRQNNEFFARMLFSFFNAFTTAIGCALLFALVRMFGYSQLVSIASTLIYGLATLAWPYAKYDFSEPTLVMFVLTTIYLIFRWGQDRRDKWMLLAGISAFASVATKYFAGVLVPFLLLEAVLLHWEKHPSLKELRMLIKPVALFCSPFVVVAAPAVWYLGHRYGYSPSILDAWAGAQRGWLSLPMNIGLWGLLFSPGRSFFLYSPPMVLAIFSFVPFVRRHGLKTVGILSIILIYFLIYSKKPAWHGGAGWGPRYQVLVIPLVILLIAPLIEKAIHQRHRLARYALVATFVIGVAFQLLAVTIYFENYLGVFRYQIVNQMPDQGAKYGGADYYPYSSGLDEGNAITATIMAWPFSPILAHAWLLTGDLLSIGPSWVQPLKDRLLVSPPWKLFWGIDILPAHPEYGLAGFDFWSMQLRTNFPSSFSLLAIVAAIILVLETAIVTTGTRITSLFFAQSKHQRGAVRTWMAFSVLVLLLFNGIHFLI